jgi:hypothetical protein
VRLPFAMHWCQISPIARGWTPGCLSSATSLLHMSAQYTTQGGGLIAEPLHPIGHLLPQFLEALPYQGKQFLIMTASKLLGSALLPILRARASRSLEVQSIGNAVCTLLYCSNAMQSGSPRLGILVLGCCDWSTSIVVLSWCRRPEATGLHRHCKPLQSRQRPGACH